MTAITPELLKRIQESLREPSQDGRYALKGMGGHFVSLEELPSSEKINQLFDVEIDGKKIFVYLQVA